MKKIIDVSDLTRKNIVPYYTYLIITPRNDMEIRRINELILSKWSVSGLLYIKNMAWATASRLGYTFENGWGNMALQDIHLSILTLDRL